MSPASRLRGSLQWDIVISVKSEDRLLAASAGETSTDVSGVLHIPADLIRGVFVSFVGGPTLEGSEAMNAAWSLMQRWNEQLAERLATGPADVKIGGFTAASIENAVERFRRQRDDDYTSCDLFVQHSGMSISLGGRPVDITAMLAVYCDNRGDRNNAVVVAPAQDLTLEPS